MTDDLVSDAAVERATGKPRDEWFAILDRWQAHEKAHGEIARYLVEEHDVAGWWAQTVAVDYERARGMRRKHERPDGFAISASRTIDVPVDVLFRAVVDDDERRTWLTDATMSLRTAQPGRSARFDWEDGSTRVNVGFAEKGPAKSTVAIEHERLADADAAEAIKALWRQRLAELKSRLES